MSTFTDINRQDAGMVDAVGPLSMADVAGHWKRLMVLGVLTIVLGLSAMLIPQAASIAATLLVGALLLVNGVLEGVHAAHLRRRRGQFWRILGAVVAIVVGAGLLIFPLAGVMSLTLVVAAFFIAEGVIKAGLSFSVRPLSGWGWLLFSGLVALALGIMITALWPQAALWVLGLLLGIDLLFGGWWLVFLALAGRRWAAEQS